MMKSYGSFLVCAALLVMSFLWASCENVVKPAASGSPYEVLVVADDGLWDRPAGHALYKALDTDIPGLPQPESSFRISQLDTKRFSKVSNIFRNIIKVDVDSTQYTQSKMKFSRDVYSHPQVVLTIQSPNEAEFARFVTQNAENIVDFFVRVEMNRLINEVEEKHSTVAEKLAKELFDCQLWAPDEINSSKKGTDFFWASSNGRLNICMYTYPYEGPQTFNKQYVLAKRDSVMEVNIPGERPGMFMTTDTAYTTVKPIVVKGQYAMEIRGLWYVEHDAMGGPFVSHSRVDTLNNRVVVVEGFVYAPDRMKRILIRRLEGSLYTLCLPGEQERELKANIPEVDVVATKKNK